MKINKKRIGIASFLLINLFTIALVNANTRTVPNSIQRHEAVSLPDHDAPFCGTLVNPTTTGSTSYFADSDPLQLNQIDLNQQECYVPCDQIYTGQVKDGIPSIDNPVFVNPGNSNAPHPREKVIGIVVEGEARAYPYDVLNWHEIVNDEINGIFFSVTLCPLTGSGILYFTDALANAELGTSGKLYENNLVFYDRITDTQFSQMGNIGIRGEQIGVIVEYSAAVETTWEAWQRLYPDTVVLSRDTGIARDYDRYPYGTYRSDRSIYFPTTFNDNEVPYNLYHEKTLTQILQIDGEVLLLPFPELEKSRVLNHQFNNQDFLTLYEPDEALVLTYSVVVNDNTLKFSDYQDNSNSLSNDLALDLPLVVDEGGTIWNYNGLAISGPLQGEQLTLIATYNAMWFAASTFFPNSNILVVDGENIQFDVTPELQDEGFASFPQFFFVGLLALIIPVYVLRRKN